MIGNFSLDLFGRQRLGNVLPQDLFGTATLKQITDNIRECSPFEL